MKRIIFFVGFGFLPLWAANVLVFLGSLRPSVSSEYWAIAPWLIVAAVPVCGVTLAIASVTLDVYNFTSGSPSRKSKFAALSFLSLVLVIGAIATSLWKQNVIVDASQTQRHDG